MTFISEGKINNVGQEEEQKTLSHLVAGMSEGAREE